MIHIQKLAFTGDPVTDLPRARAFYEGSVGLAPSTSFGGDQAGWIDHDIGPGTLVISNVSPDGNSVPVHRRNTPSP